MALPAPTAGRSTKTGRLPPMPNPKIAEIHRYFVIMDVQQVHQVPIRSAIKQQSPVLGIAVNGDGDAIRAVSFVPVLPQEQKLVVISA